LESHSGNASSLADGDAVQGGGTLSMTLWWLTMAEAIFHMNMGRVLLKWLVNLMYSLFFIRFVLLFFSTQ